MKKFNAIALPKMGYFGKAIALLFYTKILNQNTAFLVHKNTSKSVKS